MRLHEVIKHQDMLIEKLREDLKAANTIISRNEEDAEIWVWQGDGYDNLNSMVGSLPVLIQACELRHLLKHGEEVPQ